MELMKFWKDQKEMQAQIESYKNECADFQQQLQFTKANLQE